MLNASEHDEMGMVSSTTFPIADRLSGLALDSISKAVSSFMGFWV